MKCQHWFIDCKKCTTWVEDLAVRDAVSVVEGGGGRGGVGTQ